MSVHVIQSEILQWCTQYRGERFQATLGDCPYGIGFMSARWDKFTPQGYQAWVRDWASAMIENVLAPGAVAILFGGRDTWHRLACGLEDAGFDVFDTMMWVYAQGWPKGARVGKKIDPEGVSRESLLWDGHRTDLKPAWEPAIMARAPTLGLGFADLALRYGTGSLWIDGERLAVDPGGADDPRLGGNGSWKTDKAAKLVYSGGYAGVDVGSSPLGRVPADFAMVHLGECQVQQARSNGRVVDVWTCAPGCPVAELDRQSGVLRSGKGVVRQKSAKGGARNGGVYGDESRPVGSTNEGREYGDVGGASRFFYCAKAKSGDRHDGCHNLCWRVDKGSPSGYVRVSPQTWATLPAASRARGNIHIAVKPLPLTTHLARLLLPPVDGLGKRRILVPFAGSGSEMIGGARAGWDEIAGIEVVGDYCLIATTRLRAVTAGDIIWEVP